MSLSILTEDEKKVVFDCLRCVASGDVILHDWEFHTIMGIKVQEFVEVVNLLPNIDDSDEGISMLIANAMNNLLGYPHGKQADWTKYISFPQSEVARVFAKWRGEQVTGYFDGIR